METMKIRMARKGRNWSQDSEILSLKAGLFFLFLPMLLPVLLTHQRTSQHDRLNEGTVELGTTPTPSP